MQNAHPALLGWGGSGDSKAGVQGRATMEPIRVNDVHDVEIDMNRLSQQRQSGSKVRRLITSILRFSPGTYAIGTPRRSIDREQQSDVPFYE
jgi:hypothetical protein